MQLQTVSGLQNYQQIKGNTEFVLHCTFSLMLWIIMITMFRIKIKRHKKNVRFPEKHASKNTIRDVDAIYCLCITYVLIYF